MWRRILYSLIVILSVFVLPWWVPMLLSIAGAFYFKYFVELIFVGAMIDTLYGVGLMHEHVPYAFTLITSLLLAAVSLIKKRMIMY